jgi:hypothetical protein
MSRSALEYLRHILEEAKYLMTMAQGSRFAQILSGFRNGGRVLATEEVPHGRTPDHSQ